MITVLVADDQALVRHGFALILNSDPEIEVVGEVADGVQALAVARALRPDLVLMDIRMPEMDGIEATRHLTAGVLTSGIRVLVLTTFDADEYVYDALLAGASGFLLKDTPPAELISAVKTVAAGDALLSPAVTRRLIERFVLPAASPAGGTPWPPAGPSNSADPAPANRADQTGSASQADPADRSQPADLPPLTQRELVTLNAVARGLSNVEIAAEMYVSYSTVKTHVSHLLSKLGARDRAQLVVVAYRSGLAGPAPSTPTGRRRSDA